MLDIKGDIEKKKAEKEAEGCFEKDAKKKQTADEKLKEDVDKMKSVVTKVTAPVKAVWHFVPDTAKTVLLAGLGGGVAANLAEKAKSAVTGK